MDWLDKMNSAIDYIESNLTDEINFEDSEGLKWHIFPLVIL